MTPDPPLIEQLLLALAAIFDRTGCPAMVVTEAVEEGISISLHFSADRARAFIAGQGSAALPSEVQIEAGVCALMKYPEGGELDVPQAVAAILTAAMRATTPTAPNVDG